MSGRRSGTGNWHSTCLVISALMRSGSLEKAVRGNEWWNQKFPTRFKAECGLEPVGEGPVRLGGRAGLLTTL